VVQADRRARVRRCWSLITAFEGGWSSVKMRPAIEEAHLLSTPHPSQSTGKVHGSLARAGKVRGQTPKVPKQEKKKKPTGRACKRMKYNRRFVNVGE
jgi:small subunit ribosomal protein S30e